MREVHSAHGPAGSPEPWFTLYPWLALAVAVVSVVAVFVLRLVVAGSKDPIEMLYVFPVALVALAFGFRAGTTAGLVSVGLLVAWVIIADETLSPLGWLCSVTPLLLLGSLVGASSDRIRDARRSERYATGIALLQRDAAEVNDSIIQGLIATKWLLESGKVERAIETLDATTVTAEELVTRVLGSESLLPIEVRRPLIVKRLGPPPPSP